MRASWRLHGTPWGYVSVFFLSEGRGGLTSYTRTACGSSLDKFLRWFLKVKNQTQETKDISSRDAELFRAVVRSPFRRKWSLFREAMLKPERKRRTFMRKKANLYALAGVVG